MKIVDYIELHALAIIYSCTIGQVHLLVQYKTIVKMHYFKKNLLKFSSGHIHLIQGPILRNWVPFYFLEHKEFENLFIVFVF